MYLTVIAWIYVVLLMSIAEATSTTGTVLGALMTFLLYGVLPLSIVMYLMGSPSRRRALKAQEKQAWQAGMAKAPKSELESESDSKLQSEASGSNQPDASGHAPRPTDASRTDTAAAPVREKP